MKELEDIRAQFKRETGYYADTDSDLYLEWLERKVVEKEKRTGIPFDDNTNPGTRH